MATSEHCAELYHNRSGSIEGRVRPGWALGPVHERASEVLAFYRGDADPAYSLPLYQIPRIEGAFRIERVVRPAEGETGRWEVRFTRRRADEETELRYELEMDPEQRWWATRRIRERAGTWRSETKAEYE
jgi:hypothetical protein